MKTSLFQTAVVLFNLFFLASAAQAQTWQWAKRGGGGSPDEGFGIAVDDSGNSYVTGYFQNTASFGGQNLSSGGERDVFVVKYDSLGNVVWARRGSGNRRAEGFGIAVDDSGNSYVTGWFRATVTFGGQTLTAAGGANDYDIFVVKYDAAGNVVWAKRGGGTSAGDVGSGIAIDASGNCYVTGNFVGTATFGGDTLASTGGFDVFVVKYDALGTVVWAKREGGVSNDYGEDIALDVSGNIHVTGSFLNTASFGGQTLTSSGGDDIFVVKYDTSGTVVWAKRGGGSSDDQGVSLEVDASGNSYVTGGFQGTASFGGQNLTSTGINDVFVVKYDTAGNVVWAKRGGGSSYDYAYGIAVDDSGNSYVTGPFSGTASYGGKSLTSSGSLDGFVVKYDTVGNVVWLKRLGGASDDAGNGIAVDGSSNCYLIGSFQGTASFGAQNLTSSGNDDLFVAKLGPCSSVAVAVNESICQGTSYAFAGQNLTAAGTYVGTLTTADGCDSIVTLNLTIKPVPTATVFTDTICQGTSYPFGGQNLTIGGTYNNTLTAANGCDSIVTLNLTVNATDLVVLDDSVQQGQAYQGSVYTNDTILFDTLQNASGCDSIVQTNLKILLPASIVGYDLASDVHIYPNPAKGQFTIQTSQEGDKELRILDATGKQVALHRFTSTQQTIATEGLPAGLYILQVVQDGRVSTHRFVVE